MCCVYHSIIPNSLHHHRLRGHRGRHWKLKIYPNKLCNSQRFASRHGANRLACISGQIRFVYITYNLRRISDSMIASVPHSAPAIIIIIIHVDLLFEFFMISLIFISFSVQLGFIGYIVRLRPLTVLVHSWNASHKMPSCSDMGPATDDHKIFSLLHC